MLTLTLNNHPAIIKSGTTFKLTRVNPYFDTTGDYTFEVTLPLAGCPQNRIIFGNIDRPQIPHAPLIGQRYTMQLIAPPITLRGYATITSITESEVKVQLVAGTGALLNSLPDDDDDPTQTTYIDKLPLGNAWDTWPSYTIGHNQYTPGKSIHDQKTIFCHMESDGTIDPHIMAYGTYGQTDAVCFPVYMQEEDIVCNGWTVYDDDNTNPPHLAYFEDGDDEKHILPDIDDSRLTPQPYLLDILQRIIRATGYTIGDWSTYTNNPLTNGLFIVNGRNSIKRADALPHWTLKEFITQVQNFLGATFTIADDGHTVNLIPRPDYYSARRTTPITLTNITDTHTTELDQKTTNNDNSAANVTYKFATDDPQLILPEEVWQNAQVIELLSIADIQAHFNALTDDEKAQSRYLYHDRLSHCTYAILHRADANDTYELAEVDLCAPLAQDKKKRSDMTELKIVPAHTVRSAANWYGYFKGNSYAYEDTYAASYAYPLITSSSTTDSPESAYSVDQAINDSDDTTDDTTDDTSTSDLDILELAWHGGIDNIYFQSVFYTSPVTNINIQCPITIPYFKDDKSGFFVTPDHLHIKSLLFPPHGPFSLADTDPAQAYTIGSIGTLLTGAAKIDTRIEHQIQFTDNIPLDPTRTLLIHSRRYAIHKLEITLDPNGIQPLKTAYLYEIQ